MSPLHRSNLNKKEKKGRSVIYNTIYNILTHSDHFFYGGEGCRDGKHNMLTFYEHNISYNNISIPNFSHLYIN